MKGILIYPDYEEADRESVSEMECEVCAAGGKVVRTIASEDDCEALIGIEVPDETVRVCISKVAKENGWEVRWMYG